MADLLNSVARQAGTAEGVKILGPCADCGVCCRSFRVSFYHGEPQVPAEMTVQITPFLACMKGTEHGSGPCIALRDNLCSIYSNRPSICRDFPAVIDGARNPKCVELRAKFGIG